MNNNNYLTSFDAISVDFNQKYTEIIVRTLSFTHADDYFFILHIYST